MTRYFGVLASDIHWTAEPGRFFVEDAFYLACRVLGIRQLHPSPPIDVYINHSIYKNFRNMSMELPTPTPLFLMGARNANGGTYEFDSYRAAGLFLYAVWGETGSPVDRIQAGCHFTRPVQVDDWIIFPKMGGKGTLQL